jgi:hypothetical protein
LMVLLDAQLSVVFSSIQFRQANLDVTCLLNFGLLLHFRNRCLA